MKGLDHVQSTPLYPKIALAFDHISDFHADHFFPTGIPLSNFLQGIPREDPQTLFVVVHQLIDAAPVDEILVEIAQLMGHSKIINGD